MKLSEKPPTTALLSNTNPQQPSCQLEAFQHCHSGHGACRARQVRAKCARATGRWGGQSAPRWPGVGAVLAAHAGERDAQTDVADTWGGLGLTWCVLTPLSTQPRGG